MATSGYFYVAIDTHFGQRRTEEPPGASRALRERALANWVKLHLALVAAYPLVVVEPGSDIEGPVRDLSLGSVDL